MLIGIKYSSSRLQIRFYESANRSYSWIVDLVIMSTDSQALDFVSLKVEKLTENLTYFVFHGS